MVDENICATHFHLTRFLKESVTYSLPDPHVCVGFKLEPLMMSMMFLFSCYGVVCAEDDGWDGSKQRDVLPSVSGA